MTTLHTEVDTEPFWVDLPGLTDPETKTIPRVKTHPWSGAAEMAARTKAIMAIPVKGEREEDEVWEARTEAVLRELGYGPLLKLGLKAASLAALDDLTHKALALALIVEFEGLHANNAETPLDADDAVHVGAFLKDPYAATTWKAAAKRRANGVVQEGNGSGPSSNGDSARAAGSVRTASSGAMDASSPEGAD